MKQHPYIGKTIEIESDCELGQKYRIWTIIGRFSRKNNLELKRNDKCGDDFLSKYRIVECDYIYKKGKNFYVNDCYNIEE